MAKIKGFSFYCLLLLCVSSCNFHANYKVDPETRLDNVIVDTVTSPVIYEEVVIPEIPADSSQRLEDDPPVEYQTPREEIVVVVPVLKPLRERLRDLYLSQSGVKERTGNNDGPQVEAYLKSVGLGKGYAWCAAFLRWNFDSVKVKTNITAWAPTGHNAKNVVFFKNVSSRKVRPGDTFTLWYASLKRIGHTGFVDSESNGWLETMEGNTNAQGSREGNQAAKRKRLKSTVYSITSFIND